MSIEKGFYKLSQKGLTNTVRPLVGQGLVVDDPAVALTTVASAAKNIGSDALASIVIDGTTYDFSADAATVAAVETEVRAALTSAGYEEVGGVAITITGGTSATVVTITSKAAITKFVSAAAADVAFSAV